MTPIPTPHWTAYWTALGTPIVALLAALLASYFAYRNHKTAHTKLKFDLYERRLKLYGDVTYSMYKVQVGEMSMDPIDQFRKQARESLWLFGPKVQKLLTEKVAPAMDQMVKARGEYNSKRDLPDDEVRLEAKGQAEERLGKLSQDLAALVDPMLTLAVN